MMAGQAGWYHAHGEDGLLRYWNGSAWTEHRQPDPDATVVATVEEPAVAEPAVVVEPTVELAVERAVEPTVAVASEPVAVPEAARGAEPAFDSSPAQTSAPTPIADSLLAAHSTMPRGVWEDPAAETVPDWSMDQFEKQFADQVADVADEPLTIARRFDDAPAESVSAEPLPAESASAGAIALGPVAAKEEPAPAGSTPADSKPSDSAAADDAAFDLDAFDALKSDPEPFDPATYQPVGFESPTFDNSAYDDSPYTGPAYDGSPYDSPASKSPAYDSPAYNGPAYDGSGPGSSSYDPTAFAGAAGEQALAASQAPVQELASVSASSSASSASEPTVSVSRFSPEAGISAALRYAPAPTVEAESQVKPLADELIQPATERPVDLRRKRKGLVASVRWMLAGVAIILIGGALMFFATVQPITPAGQSQTLGIITSLGAANGGCAPTAQFAGPGGSYSATSGAGISPCPFQLGQSVTVVYTASAPSTTGRIVLPNLFDEYAWVVPVVGLLTLVVSVFAFIAQAGSIAAGVTIVREGGKAPKQKKSAQTDRAQANPTQDPSAPPQPSMKKSSQKASGRARVRRTGGTDAPDSAR